jgi:hypothetical protein
MRSSPSEEQPGPHGVVAHDDPGVGEDKFAREAASKARTPPRVSRRTWCCMSSEAGRDPTMTLLSRLSHHRTTAPQQWTEESQVMVTTRASPVWPAVKASYGELVTGGQRGRPASA